MNKKKISSIIFGIIPIILLFLFWELLADYEILNQALFSKPTIIFPKLYEKFPELIHHFFATVYRLLVSFFIALGIGIAVGMLMGYKKIIYRSLNPLITTVMTVPGIAMAPIFILWFGFGDPTIITIGIIVSFFPIVYNVAMGVRSVDKKLVQAASIMGGKRKNIFLNVYLPHSVSHIIIGIKLGLARCWRTIVAVEFIAATSYGLGYMIWDAYEYLNFSVVYGGIIVMAILFFTIEKTAIRLLEKRTIERWGLSHENE